MAQFGYSYRSISTYNTSNGVRNIETGGHVAKPYAPTSVVPKFKKIIPVGSSRKGYEDESDDDDDDGHARHTSPRKFDDFITKVRNEASRSPPRSTHVTSPPNNPIPKHHDAYAHYSPRNPIAPPVNHDGYVNKDHHAHGYGDYINKDGPKPTATPVYNTGHDADYNYRDGIKPTGSPVYKTGYGDYNGRQGPKPKPTGSPVYNSGYGDHYDNFNNRKGPKPTGSPVYNTGYGPDYNRQGPKPTSIPVNQNGYGGYGSGSASPTRYGNYYHDKDYDDYSNYHNNKKGSSWSDLPRKGTQLSKATNNIEEAMEMLMKEAAAMPMRNGPMPYEYDNKPAHREGSRPAPASTYDRTMNLVNETERLKNIVTGGGAPRTERPKGNLMPQRFNFNDGNRSQGYDEHGVINHKEAEKKFNGVTLDHNQLYAQDY